MGFTSEARNKERNEGKVEELSMILFNLKKKEREERKKREERRGGGWGGRRREKRREKARDRQRSCPGSIREGDFMLPEHFKCASVLW